MEQQQRQQGPAGPKQLLAEARERCSRRRQAVGSGGAPSGVLHAHASLLMQLAKVEEKQTILLPSRVPAAAAAEPACSRSRPVGCTGAVPAPATCCGCTAEPTLLSPAVSRLDTTDCAVLELLQAAAELAPPREPQQRAHTHAFAEQRRPPSACASTRGYGQQQPRQRQRKPASPLAKALAALRRSAEQQSAAAVNGGGTAEASDAAADSLLPQSQRQESSNTVHVVLAQQAPKSSLVVPRYLPAEAAAGEDVAGAATAAAAAVPSATCTSAATARAVALAPVQPVTAPACAGGHDRPYNAAGPALVHPALVQPTRATSPGSAPRNCGQEEAGAGQSVPPMAGAAAAHAAWEPSPAGQAGEQPSELGLSAGPAACDSHEVAATSAAAEAAALDAAAATLRGCCAAGSYQEAREVLREAGSHMLPMLLAARDAQGRTPLLLACVGGHGRLVKLLLRKGAPLDAPDGEGNTALALAVRHGHQALARHLLECGADASRRNASGTSAADLIADWAAQSDQERQLTE